MSIKKFVGGTVSGGNFDFTDFTDRLTTGEVFDLSQWTGYTLRQLSLSVWCNASAYSAITISSYLPRSLHPQDLDRQALWTFLIRGALYFNSGLAVFDFAPGLIRVNPGRESLYLIVYDFMVTPGNYDATCQWALNMLWEPYKSDCDSDFNISFSKPEEGKGQLVSGRTYRR